jgi:hypothetical protein
VRLALGNTRQNVRWLAGVKRSDVDLGHAVSKSATQHRDGETTHIAARVKRWGKCGIAPRVQKVRLRDRKAVRLAERHDGACLRACQRRILQRFREKGPTCPVPRIGHTYPLPSTQRAGAAFTAWSVRENVSLQQWDVQQLF